MNAYGSLAAVYDKLNAEVPYAAVADFYEAAFRLAGVRPELVLDLGCGTGSMTLELARRGYDMIGLDASPDMLAVAYERKAQAGLDGVLLLCQDMRAFELYGTVGAVVSTLDCVNYLTDDGDLDKCFSLVHNYLDPGGLFLFDVNTPYKFRHVFGNNAYILEDEDCFCAWQNDFDAKTGLCRFDLSVFRADGEGRYGRADETQLERCYTQVELTAALTRAGFDGVTFYGDTDLTAPHAETERWYVSAVCKK